MRQGRFYAGLFLLTFSTLILEIVETRILSVVTWYHLAFFVISSAMFGMTAGAVWIYVRRDRFTAARLSHDLAWLTTAFAISTSLSLVFQLTLATAPVASVSGLAAFAELAVALAVPFFFSGAAVSLALTRSPLPIGKVYAVDLAGAALGCLGALLLLEVLDGPSVVLAAAAAAAGAAALFRGSGFGERPAGERGWTRLLGRPGLVALVLLLLAVGNSLTTRGLHPLLVKSRIEERSSLLYERWNSFSRVEARHPFVMPPVLWGASPRLPAGTRAEQINMAIDGAAGTTMVRFDGDLERVSFLRYDVTNLAHFARPEGRVAVIGVGSGRDLLSARVFGKQDVTGVEINPIFVDLLTSRAPFREFAGLADEPGVRFEVDEARSWMTRSTDRFDLIQMSMIDTWAATGAGAFTLSENGLYTIEAWTTFLERLAGDGMFTVSRWHGVGELNETGRMVSLAVASLMELGVPEPGRHLFLASSSRVATLVLAKAPLTPEELERLHGACDSLRYDVLLTPGQPSPSPLLESIRMAPDRAALERAATASGLDLTPPTDERPFFFNLLPLNRPHLIGRFLGGEAGVVRGNLTATLTLLTILVISLFLVAVTIVVPLTPAIRETGRETAVGGTAYFALIGLGFMLAEMGYLQRLSVFLGHPIYALSVVLFGIILATGVGSFVSDRFPLDRGTRLVGWGLLLGGFLLSLPLWLPAVLRTFQTADLPVRVAVSVGVIVPAGILLGFGFPTGMRLVQRRDPRPTPWFWGINGAAGVFASVVAVAVSIAFGIGFTITLAGLCYLATIPFAIRLAATPGRA